MQKLHLFAHKALKAGLIDFDMYDYLWTMALENFFLDDDLRIERDYIKNIYTIDM